MISCSKAKEMIDSYIDGDISEADMTAFEDHISTCDDCRELYEFTSQLTSALKRSIQQPPADFTARVMDRVRQEAAQPVKQRKIVPFLHGWKAYGSAAAAVLLLAVIGKTAVYDNYIKVVQPPADTAYVTDAPGVPDVQGRQTAEPEQEIPDTPVQPEVPLADVPQQAADSRTGQQSSRLPAAGDDAAAGSLTADTAETGEMSQPADGESQQQPVEAPVPETQPAGQATDADGGEAMADVPVDEEAPPLLKSSLHQDMSESAQDAAVGYQAAGTDDQSAAEGRVAAEESAMAFAAPSAAGSEGSGAGTASGGGSAANTAGGGGSAGGASAASISVPAKVCHVTISKSGEGNLLAVQRRLSAAIDGTIDHNGGQLIVTVDAADFEATLEEIEATGFVVDVQTTDSTGTQSVFYIE